VIRKIANQRAVAVPDGDAWVCVHASNLERFSRGGRVERHRRLV
jgi:hypothetical protein